MQKTAIVLATNDLVTDQRVHKTCTTLQECGYWVVEFGFLRPRSLPLKRSYFTLRPKLWFLEGPIFYAEFNIRLFFYLMTTQVDLIFANDLDTLPAAFLAAKLRHKRLIFDAHELFIELPELADRAIVRKFWEKLENYMLPHLKETITVCKSIADIYNKKYNLEMKVVRNTPLYRTDAVLKKISYPGKKIILYQGSLNLARGLEWVIDAMSFVENAMLVIIGAGDIKKNLEVRVKDSGVVDKVVFLGEIDGELLYQYTSSANIGLCLLEQKGLNYYYALPNRIFDYIHAGVPVLATNFPEIANIVETYKTGVLIDHYEPVYLAKTINNMLENPMDTSHFEAVAKELCWENEKKVLKSIING
jgi:glycosyltransferase involved in cell wall biosynthesis